MEMPSVVALIKVKEDKVDEAKTFFAKLARDTVENETGTLVYLAHATKDDPTSFVFYEKYEDEAALAVNSKNLRSVGKEFGALLDGAPKIMMLDEL